eukprot:CAMPEP_0179325742 /NCGR_PEP_ID=MMETSP0797-20121207/61056_1 /TAXON_ID=47934 /ORGANISM="Dinophysis acuminata, Strain DAEP01" /LENGTH=74 /DNA_ID=CAMNT_0021037951 /DNA_START=53 /DNA_END=274 /DNA_ORIENTATION=+
MVMLVNMLVHMLHRRRHAIARCSQIVVKENFRAAGAVHLQDAGPDPHRRRDHRKARVHDRGDAAARRVPSADLG